MYEYFDSADILDEVASVFADEFDAPISEVLTARIDGNGVIYGDLISGGNVYEYAANKNQLATVFLPEETNRLNYFFAGSLASSYGINADSVDSPYEYALGFLRLDAQAKCTKGGVPCGKICLPKGAKCKKYGGAGNVAAMRNVGRKLKSPGVDGAVVAGTLAATALAGGAAVANRGKIEKAPNTNRTPEDKINSAIKKGYERNLERIRKKGETDELINHRVGQWTAKQVGKVSKRAGGALGRHVEKTSQENKKRLEKRMNFYKAGHDFESGAITGAVSGVGKVARALHRGRKAQDEFVVNTAKKALKGTENVAKKVVGKKIWSAAEKASQARGY
jgi:hypothetical protein